MKVVEYQTIYTIKESEKAKVVLAAIDGREGPVVVKRLKGVKPDIYQFLAQIHNPHIPEVYAYEVTEQELIVAEEYVDGLHTEGQAGKSGNNQSRAAVM